MAKKRASNRKKAPKKPRKKAAAPKLSKADAKRTERRRKRRQRSALSDQRSDDGDTRHASGKAAGKGPRRGRKADAAGDGKPSDSEGRRVATADQQQSAADRHRNQAARRSRERYAEAGELGELPPVVDPERRAACEFDPQRFVESYCLAEGMVALSDLHEKIIEDIGESMLHGGLYAQAIFRGFAKTTIAVWLIVWAALYGHRRYLVLFGLTTEEAEDLLDDVKQELLENDRIAEDFPEIVFPIKEIGGKAQRAVSQTYQGEKTGGVWKNDEIVLPKCGDSPGGHCTIIARPKGRARGLRRRMPDGSRQRPDYFLADDVESDDSAVSAKMIEKLINLIFKSWVPMSGHFKKMAGVINGTNIARGSMIDQATDPDNGRFGSFHKRRVPMVQQWADAHESFWLEEYAPLYTAFGATDAKAKLRSQKKATELYLANQERADAGCVVAWEGAYEEGEASAIQHAYNQLLTIGEEAFACECQGSPLKKKGDEILLPANVIALKQHGFEPGVVPRACTHLVAMVDQQDSVLYWLVSGWANGWTGYIIDYGSWPDQELTYFSLSGLRHSLQEKYRQSDLPQHGGAGHELSTDAAITAGLTDLMGVLFAPNRYAREGGGHVSLDRVGVDTASGQRTKTIREWMSQSPYRPSLTGMQGRGVRAKDAPMAEWPAKSGERRGLEWVEKRTDTGLPLVIYNTNYHKRQFFDAMRLPMGSMGCMALPKVTDEAQHQMFADHCTATTCQLIKSRDREAYELEDKPGADNHLFDCAVGSRVIALRAGVTPPGGGIRVARRRRGKTKSRKL